MEFSIDFVTNSYGESWDWSCEKPSVPAQKHWLPVQKHECPGSLCNHTVIKERLQNSVLQFTEIKIFSFYCRSQQRLKEICAVKQQPHEQPHKSHRWDILQKPLQFDQSITKKIFSCASFFFCVRDAGHRGNKITGLVWKIFVSGYLKIIGLGYRKI